MRKLVYIGKDNNDTIVKTASFEEMKMWKEKGFQFTEEMEEIEEEYKPTERAKKIEEILKKRLTK